MTQDEQKQAPLLPAIRQGLRLMEGPPGEDGSPTWALHDPLRNQFFRMGRQAFSILSMWQIRMPVDEFVDFLAANGTSSEVDEVLGLIEFLVKNNLVELQTHEQTQYLCHLRSMAKVSPLKWLLKNYLYFRVPLLRPDRFLERTLPLISPLYSRWTWRILFLIGIVGVYLASRQWEVFWTTFQDFFNVRGMIVFGITLIFVKMVHELGHAYTAKRMGCKVPVMGVAFLVMYPMLYTDTTDSWRLKSHRQRLAISVAGVKVELAMAMIATFLWSFLGEGVLRSAAFFVATVSWVGSLAVNMSPFMRFDGYYALADWLGAENLQERAFALARWHTRKLLFGLEDPKPEVLSRRREIIFVLYAWGTWLYRFFLFLGIALLVYHAFFKALGIILFAVEIVWFLALPIYKELAVWWKRRSDMEAGRIHKIYPAAVLTIVVLLCIPWQSTLTLPAVLKAEKFTYLHSLQNGKIEQVNISAGDVVREGDLLVTITSPELESARRVLQVRERLIGELLARSAGSSRELGVLTVLRMQQAEVRAQLAGIEEQIGILDVRAPFDGTVVSLEKIHSGQWVSPQVLLGTMVKRAGARVEAYVEEHDLARVASDAKARFLPDMNGTHWLDARVETIETMSVVDLQDRMLASVHGGDISARPVQGHQGDILTPEAATYRIHIALDEPAQVPQWVTAGVVRISGEKASLAGRFFRYIAVVLIRESGF